MRRIDPDLVRKLVRQALEDELGLSSTEGGERPPTSSSRTTEHAAQTHPSHLDVITECGGGGDFSPGKSCLIEPHRLCSNSGYCKKLGY
jgi:hypothetical protein